MSFEVEIDSGLLRVKMLTLPSRYFYFKPLEFMKLVHIGEGFFPSDRVSTKIRLKDSNLILTNESATKVYASSGEFSGSRFFLRLGLIKRVIYPVVPPKVEYQLTSMGESVIPKIGRAHV